MVREHLELPALVVASIGQGFWSFTVSLQSGTEDGSSRSLVTWSQLLVPSSYTEELD